MTQELFFKVSNSNETVKNQIRDKIKNSFQAVGEYVWNAVDAKADKIEINIKHHGTLLQGIEIKDNGEGINYEEVQESLFKILSDSPKAKLQKDYLTLPHGKNGTGRFAFTKFAYQINWETVYTRDSKNYGYEISIDGNALNDVQKVQDKKLTEANTGTRVKITRIINTQDLIKQDKKPLRDIERFLLQEFYSVMKLRGIKIYLNKKPLDITSLISKEPTKTISLEEKKFKIRLVVWKEGFCKDSKYYFLNKNGEEVYNMKSLFSRYDHNFLHSVYVVGDLFDDFCPVMADSLKEGAQKHLLDETKYKIFRELLADINKYVNNTRSPLNDKFAKKTVEDFEKKGYFDEVLKTKTEKEYKKQYIKGATTAVIKFAPKLLDGLKKEQTLVLLNLINKLMDDDKDTLLEILKILLKDENEDSLKELKEMLDKYEIGAITSLLHEIEKRFKTIDKIDEMHYYDQNKDYNEKLLQNLLEDNFWVFGDQYSSLLCSEEEDFTKMRNIYIKEILKEDPSVFNDSVSQKQVDLFMHGFLEGDSMNRNLIVEIKAPEKKLTKEIYHEQLVEYSEIIRKRPEFKDPNKNDWSLILIGHDFEDDFFETHYKKKADYLMEDIESMNMKLYVMRWSDILSDLKTKYKFIKDKLNLKKSRIVEGLKMDSNSPFQQQPSPAESA